MARLDPDLSKAFWITRYLCVLIAYLYIYIYIVFLYVMSFYYAGITVVNILTIFSKNLRGPRRIFSTNKFNQYFSALLLLLTNMRVYRCGFCR